MSTTRYAYIDGKFIPEAEACVSVLDRGFLYGDGCFETMRVYGGRVFRLSEHITRLVMGMNTLGIGGEEVRQDLRSVCEELVGRNRVLEGMARIYVTRGCGNVGLSVKSVGPVTVVAIAQSRKFSAARVPLRVMVSRGLSIDPHSPLARVKSANRLPHVLAKIEAERGGSDDALLLNTDGNVAELTASNVFLYQRGRLFTPPLGDGALPGITRGLILMLAARVGVTVEEASFPVAAMFNAEEAFATNSLLEITPIASVDDHEISGRRIAVRLSDAYQEHVRAELKLP